MPRVGSSKISTLRLHRQPLGEHDLLLVAAGQRADARVDADGVRMSSRRRCRSAFCGLARRVDHAGRGHRPARFGSEMFSAIDDVEQQAASACGPRAPGRCRWSMASRGERDARSARRRGGPRRRAARSMPKMARASSVRPEPTRPARPRISPRAQREVDRLVRDRSRCATPTISSTVVAGRRLRAACRATSGRGRSSAGSSRRGAISSRAELADHARRRAARRRGRRSARPRSGGAR